ncbi:MAG: endolytic transglycosylase MltG [bacterium]|nr:endolytic transglycosylase MltG [bacterium]
MKILNAIIAGIVGLLALGGIVFWYFTTLLQAPDSAGNAREVDIEISEGMGVKEIAARLEGEGIIKSATAFEYYVWIEGLASKILAGNYLLNTGQSMGTTLDIITEGVVDVGANEVTFRVLEGWTVAQIAELYGETFTESLDAEADELRSAFIEQTEVTDSREIIPGDTYEFLIDKPADQGLEGYLFPDTYRVFKDATPAQIIQKMLSNFDQKLTEEARAQIADSGLSVYETITLASIVEREVQTDRDRRMVADLFLRRMEAGIPLQSDATVNYVTGKDSLQPTIDDTKTESPYNTYLHQGLPPGPISNPSLSSILAVVNPEPNEFFYYLSAPSGETIFGKTFEEHKRNKAQYLD